MNKQIIPYEAPITPRAPQPIMPGAVAVGGPNGGAIPSEDEYTHDDDRTVQIGDEPATVSENDDTRVVDASTDTVVAKAITAEELREELREELQDEMEANIVHGEVVTRIWTKRRLWITGGVVLLVIIGIVIGVVFAITMSEPSDDGDCLSDTMDLYESNPSLQAAVNAYQTDILALFLYMDPSQCNATYCAMNSTNTSSYPIANTTCTEAGGQGVSIDRRVICQDIVGGQALNYTLDVIDLFDCFAQSCTEADDFKAAYEENFHFQQIANVFEGELGWDCVLEDI